MQSERNTPSAAAIVWFLLSQCFIIVPFFIFGLTPKWLAALLCVICVLFNIFVPFLNLFLELFCMVAAFVIKFHADGFLNWFTLFFMIFPFFFVLNAYFTWMAFKNKNDGKD